MRMRFWGVLGAFCFGLLVLGSQVVVTGPADAGAVPVTVRVLGAGGAQWFEHHTRITSVAPLPTAVAGEIQP